MDLALARAMQKAARRRKHFVAEKHQMRFVKYGRRPLFMGVED
jgi:hypothetical protein